MNMKDILVFMLVVLPFTIMSLATIITMVWAIVKILKERE
jgi:hypothetical protein